MTVKEQYFKLRDDYVKARSQKDKDAILAQIDELIDKSPEEWSKAYEEGLAELQAQVRAENIRQKLAPVFELVRAKTVAERLGKNSTWISQRLNGNKARGFVYSFTPDDVRAIEEVAHQIGRELLAFHIEIEE